MRDAAPKVLEDVAFGEDNRARSTAEKLIKKATPFLPAIGRDNDATNRLGDLCLHIVRALLHQNKNNEADTWAMECLRMIPDLQPDPSVHAPWVRQQLENARQRVAGAQGTTLGIFTTPQLTQPCDVRVQGRKLGQAPLQQLALPPGEYAVQIECEPNKPGRIHTIVLGVGGRTRFEVPVYLDRALQVRSSGAWLQYPTEQAQRNSAMLDAEALLSSLRVDEMVFVVGESAGLARLDRVSLRQRKVVNVASVRVVVPADKPVAKEDIDRAVQALVSGRSLDMTTAGQPTAIAPQAYAAPQGTLRTGFRTNDSEVLGQGSGHDPWWKRPGIAGWVLGGLGLVGVGVSWVLYTDWTKVQGWLDDAEPDDFDFKSLQDQRDDRSTQTLIAGAAGLGLLTAALPFWLPDAVEGEIMPWWAWVSGGVGLALGVVGVVIWSGHNACNNASCDRLEPRVPLGPLVAMHGTPFLGVPAVYAMRALFGQSARRVGAPSAALTPDQRGMTVGWSWTLP